MEGKKFKRFLTRMPPVFDPKKDLRQTAQEQYEYLMWLHEQVDYHLGQLDALMRAQQISDTE